MPLSESQKNQLSDLIRSDRVVLFMKGTRRMPQCGFSATVVSILDELVPAYKTVDVLSDPAIRDGIKEYSQWPTIPQLFIGGEFVGGCDIVRELHASGELSKLLGVQEEEVAAPEIKLSDAAVQAFKAASADIADEELRLEVTPQFQYDLSFGPRAKGDIEVKAGGLTLLVDRASAKRANGLSIDYVEGPNGAAGFKIENPNEPPRVKALSARALKEKLDRGEKLELFDVRTDAELSIAKVAGFRQLNAEGAAYLEGLPKSTPVVFMCHHGVRSRSAAEQFLRAGFTNVHNVEGGIEAWSRDVDPSVPRY
jgi:monothiol glutaredoxin